MNSQDKVKIFKDIFKVYLIQNERGKQGQRLNNMGN